MNHSGMTLIELMTAMVVAAIVTGLVFMIYGQVVKHGFTIQKRFNSVNEAAVLKLRVDGALQGIDSVWDVSPEGLRYEKTDGCTHQIGVQDSAVSIDGAGKGMACRSLTFEVSRGVRTVVTWDAVMMDSMWVGGAVVVR